MSGETSRHQFATEIINGLRSRGVTLAVDRIVPIQTEDYPLSAPRLLNSRLNLQRLQVVFGIKPPDWRRALDLELDQLAEELFACRLPKIRL
jgi:dTDP-4-dehydrorhamnose reductase